MFGAIAVVTLSDVPIFHVVRWHLKPIFGLAARIHYLLFGRLIALEWGQVSLWIG
jgi:undecaprenyl-diphosphatase